MTTPDFLILCVSIAFLTGPLAFAQGRWCGGKRESVSKCCACGKPTPGVKCDECADFSER